MDAQKLKLACETLKADERDIAYYSWPQGFANTAGPFGELEE